MGFNFFHPQKSGGAMAPLAPPSEGALIVITMSKKNFWERKIHGRKHFECSKRNTK